MNFVSLLVYLADVLGTLNTILNVSVVLCAVPIAFGVWQWASQENGAKDQHDWDEKLEDHRRYPSLYSKPEGERPSLKNVDPVGGYLKKPVALLVSVVIMASIVPHPNTVYAIAASQAAEKVITSPTVTKAVDALNRWLDRQAK